jgi:hypothetical protein
MYTEQLTQEIGITAPVNPQTANNATLTTGGVDMQQFKRFFALVEVGAVPGGAIALQLVEDVQSSLGTATNLAGANASITGLNTANKQYTLEARADQMTKRYLGLKITTSGGANIVLAAAAFGMDSIHKPGSTFNDTSVAQQNVV